MDTTRIETSDDDGVHEVALGHARSELTRLLKLVRETGEAGALTQHGHRAVYIVTPDWYTRAEFAITVMEKLRESFSEAEPGLEAAFADSFKTDLLRRVLNL